MPSAALVSILTWLLERAAAAGSALAGLQRMAGQVSEQGMGGLLSAAVWLESGISNIRALLSDAAVFGIGWLQADGQWLNLVLLSGILLVSVWPLVTVARRLRYRLRAIRRQAGRNLKQAGESLAARRIPLRQLLTNLSAFLYEYVSQFLDWIWAYLQPHLFLYDRDHIRTLSSQLYRDVLGRLAPSAGWLRNLAPVTAPANAKSGVPASVAGRDLPPELVSAIQSSIRSLEDLPAQWLELFDRVYREWMQGLNPGLVLCGNSGSGKSTLLTVLEQRIDLPVHRLSPARRRHEEESAWLDRLYALSASEIESLAPRAVVVDNLEMFFLRQPGGFSEIKKLLRTIHATRSRIFWLLSCGTPFWDYLCHILPLEQLLPEQLKLEALDPAWLAAAYSRRVHQAGFVMRIVPDRLLLKQIRNMKRRHAIRETEIADYIQQQFFTGLLERGGLNFAFINQQLLRSVSSVSGRVLRIDPAISGVPEEVGELSLEAAFCLQNLFIHRSLTAVELASVLRHPLVDIELQLAALRSRRLIELEDGYYSVQALLFRAIYSELVKRNLFS